MHLPSHLLLGLLLCFLPRQEELAAAATLEGGRPADITQACHRQYTLRSYFPTLMERLAQASHTASQPEEIHNQLSTLKATNRVLILLFIKLGEKIAAQGALSSSDQKSAVKAIGYASQVERLFAFWWEELAPPQLSPLPTPSIKRSARREKQWQAHHLRLHSTSHALSSAKPPTPASKLPRAAPPALPPKKRGASSPAKRIWATPSSLPQPETRAGQPAQLKATLPNKGPSPLASVLFSLGLLGLGSLATLAAWLALTPPPEEDHSQAHDQACPEETSPPPSLPSPPSQELLKAQGLLDDSLTPAKSIL